MDGLSSNDAQGNSMPLLFLSRCQDGVDELTSAMVLMASFVKMEATSLSQM